MTDKKTLVHSHLHNRNSKQQLWNRQLVAKVVELVQKNDHGALALVARTTGIPPQLRHVVWPVLLKYHPMVISPGIMTNTLILVNDKYEYHRETRSADEIERHVMHDLNKYFHRWNNSGNTSGTGHNTPVQPDSPNMPPDELHAMDTLKRCIMNFLSKWDRLFKYESGLAWIAVGLAEWLPLKRGHENLVLRGRRHPSLVRLYKEYPLPPEISSSLPPTEFDFDQIFERLMLVMLHSPDISMAKKLAQRESNSNSSYYPVVSGGDLSFRSQVFFKVFSTILPELYQPFTDEETMHPSKKINWLYWWLKCSGARVLHKQDRARLWDILLGWRPAPSTINFYLNYNNRAFEHFYSPTSPSIDTDFFNKICKYGHDQFWFPDLDLLPLGSKSLKCDFQIFQELLRRNKYGTEETPLNVNETKDEGPGVKIPFSLIDPHVQLLFIYIAILQQNEFKLLEFEEAEISEFLNNVPLLSRTDDFNYKKMYTDEQELPSSSSSDDDDPNSKRPGTSSHMLIEFGNDDKALHSFDDVYNLAGDIWRKWIWRELEENNNQ